MTELAKKYMESGAPETIYHGDYAGHLIDVQPLNNGYVTGVYRFEGGVCCPSEAPAIKLSK